MENSNKKEILVTGLFTAAFLLGGFIHVAVDPWDYTSCIAQIYYGSLVLIWGVTIKYRIVNKRVRELMLLTAALFMLAVFLQMCRYRIFGLFSTAGRYFWYGYYIPLVLVPLLFLFVVLHLHLQEDERPGRCWLLMLIPSVILILLVLTNDLHQLVFSFTTGTDGKFDTYTHGILFYVLYVWIFAELLLSLYLAIKKSRIPSIVKKLWMPLYFASFSILVVLSLFEIPKIADTNVWLFIECLAMIIIGMEESCIQLGLIPANSSYRMIASLADKPFIISDESGTPVYAAQSARDLFQRKENLQIHTKPIRGGSVSWAVDLTDMIRLNQEIEQATESIQSKNEYLQTENALKEEQSRIAARNALYNQISGIVSPQLGSISRLLKGEVDDNTLARIAYFNAYIKRRSNMELLKFDRKQFPTEELTSAVTESCEYLKLCGADAMLYTTPECELAAGMQIFLYEAFETVVESCLDSLPFLLVNITVSDGHPALRLTLRSCALDPQGIEKSLSSKYGSVCFCAERDGNEAVITISRREGGRVS